MGLSGLLVVHCIVTLHKFGVLSETTPGLKLGASYIL